MSNPLDPKLQLKINRNPLQRGGQDELIRETVFGGPKLVGMYAYT